MSYINTTIIMMLIIIQSLLAQTVNDIKKSQYIVLESGDDSDLPDKISSLSSYVLQYGISNKSIA